MFLTLTKRLLATTLLIACVPAAPSQSLKSSSGSVRGNVSKLFDYKQSKPSDLKIVSSRMQNGVIVQDLNYDAYSSAHGRIKAYLVTPQGNGPFAGVLFFHWLGKRNGDRTEFLDEALAMAQHGAISLLIQGYFPWLEDPSSGQADRQKVIDQTIETRRALDLLLAQPKIDRKRIAYVGHDYGAMYGAIVAGIEDRVKAYVLMAGMGSFSDWSLKYWPATGGAGEAVYRQAMSEIDPIVFIPHAAPASLLFQFSNADKYIPGPVATNFFEEASQPKEIKWYDTPHELDIEAARSDRREWLTRQLLLPK